jgi:lysophospholipid acyltransferase (LPLAT)-like uncharacterized protein
MAALADPAIRGFFGSVRFLLDETVGGRTSGNVIKRLGGRYLLLHRSPHVERLRQLRHVIEDGDSCAFAVDGGGPYFQTNTGIIGLAASMGAAIIPIGARATPALTVPGGLQLQVPLPRCRVGVAVGTPIEVGGRDDRQEAAGRLKIALDGIRRELRTSVAEGRAS